MHIFDGPIFKNVCKSLLCFPLGFGEELLAGNQTEIKTDAPV